MTDDSPFANFVPSTPAADPPAAGKPKKARKTRTKKAAVTVTNTPRASETAKQTAARTRTPPKAGKSRKPRAIKIDLTLAMSALAGLQDDDQKFVTGVVQAMQPFGKKQRARIVAALGKIFV